MQEVINVSDYKNFETFYNFPCQDSISSLTLKGFVNYFGPQRFGLDDKEVNACDIGLAMLQGDMVTNRYCIKS